MKKDILIGSLVVINAMSLFFGFYQQFLVKTSRKEFHRLVEFAEEQRRKAEVNEQEDMQEMQLVQEELRKCREGK